MKNISSFDLNLLRVLEALMHEHSTVRAGERLGLSQPAVSAALRRLRSALGDELFFRRGQGLEPTQFALSIEASLREIMDRIEALIQGPSAFDPATSKEVFRMCEGTGCRPAEVAGLRVEDVHLDHETPHIRVEWHEDRRVRDRASWRAPDAFQDAYVSYQACARVVLDAA